MRNKPLDQLKELLEKPEKLTVDQMDCLVKNSMQFFAQFIEISKTGDKEAQERALKELVEFKEELQVIINKVGEQTGLSQSELSKVMADPENFSKEQWNSMQEITETINEFNTDIATDFAVKTPSSKPKAGRTLRRQRLTI